MKMHKMNNLVIYFFETGFQNSIPGMKDGFPAFALPFFGEYFLFDTALYNFFTVTDKLFVFVDQSVYKLALSIVDRWLKRKPELLIEGDNLDFFINHLQGQKAEYVVISSFSYVGFFNKEELVQLAERNDYPIIKLSLENTPVEVYICNRRELIKLLKKNQRRIGKRERLEHYLFENFLLTGFEVIKNIEGRLFFNTSIEQIYKSNLQLINFLSNNEILEFFKSIEEIIPAKSDSYIAFNGYVKNSFISRGVRIEGYVENSVIYPDVKISKGTKIVDSVIMNGNIVCKNSNVVHTVIFPNIKELRPGGCNIGEGSIIGEKRSKIVNEKYPNQIKNGLTVIGFNADLPHGCKIDGGCVIESDVPFSFFKGLRNLRRGQTVNSERIG